MKTIINKYRFLVIVVVIALLVLSALQFKNLKINPSFDEYIPSGVSNREYLKKLDTIFGGSEKIILILVNDSSILNKISLERVKKISNELQDVDGIERCVSLADVMDIRLEDGITIMNSIIDSIPANKKEQDKLKKTIINNELGKRFVSSDFTSTAIIITKSFNVKDKQIISDIETVIKKNKGNDKVYIAGLAFIRNSIKSYIVKDLKTLLPTALIFMLIMLYFSFREWKGVLLPFIIVIISIVLSFGFMAIMSWEISLITILLPVMLIAIANDYGIHLINLYQEKRNLDTNLSIKEISVEIYNELKKPIIITALTTIGGMLGLLSHKLPPAAELGIMSAVGIGIALLLSLFLVPVLLSFYSNKNKKPRQSKQNKSIINKLLVIFSVWVTVHPKRVISLFLTLAVLAVIGLFFLKVDTNTEEYFVKGSDIKQGIDIVNEKFGGSQYVSILFEGDVLSPEFLNRIETYTEKIKKIPQAGNVISETIFFKQLSKGIYMPNEPEYNNLPKSKAEALQSLEIFAMSGYEDQISQFIDYDYKHTRILVSLKDGSNETGKALLKSLHDITDCDTQLVCIAGPGLSKIKIADMVIDGQISSLLLAFIIVFILLSLIFKSFVAGVQASIPLVLSSLLLFGIMGIFGISLDIVNTLLSSIMIGVGVDYTIHFLWRYKQEYAKNADTKIAISNTLITVGRGIIFNAFSVIVGFSALIFSSFIPLKFFGILVVISIFACLISALLLIPAIISITKPKYLEK